MLYTQEAVKAAIRTQEGKRVFWLTEGDRLTPSAQDWLRQEKIEIVPRQEGFSDLFGGQFQKKPEEMTHLTGNTLVLKTHPRIAFRGELDSLQAQVLLCALHIRIFEKELTEMLHYLRQILRCEVMDEPLEELSLLGLSQKELRAHSQYPQRVYGQGHFQPELAHGEAVLELNFLRTQIRKTELSCCRAFSDTEGRVTRKDLVQGLNRLSSACYILMIRCKAEKEGTWKSSSGNWQMP